MKTEYDITVSQFVPKFVLAMAKRILTLNANQEFRIDLMAKINGTNVLVNQDGEFIELARAYYDGQIQFVYMIPVRILEKVKEGEYRINSQADFYIPLSEKYFDAATYKPKQFLDYLGQDYKRNKKLRLNVTKLLNHLNKV